MSARNGDKARYNRNRQRKLAKRQRVRAFFSRRPDAAAARAAVKPPVKPAVTTPAEPAARPVQSAAPSAPPKAAVVKRPRALPRGKREG